MNQQRGKGVVHLLKTHKNTDSVGSFTPPQKSPVYWTKNILLSVVEWAGL